MLPRWVSRIIARRSDPSRLLSASARRTGRALIFPGQGSQFLGMGKDFAEAYPDAKEVFDQIDAALGYKLSTLMWEGPMEELTRTSHTQPALLAHSMAIFQVLKKRFPQLCEADAVLGHSVGEYSALVAAGSLDLAEAARLLSLRGQLMQEAVPSGGAMAALMPCHAELATQVCEQARKDTARVCEVANINSAVQVVISGHSEAVQRASDLALSRGVKKATRLSVSAPFHCSLMKPAAERFRVRLAEARVRDALVPLISNVTAKPVSAATEIRQLLVTQISAPVRWMECVQEASRLDVRSTIEFGGDVLSNLIRRIEPQMQSRSLVTVKQYSALS